MSPLVLALVLALMQLALVLHTRSVITSAAEDAVRVAASFGGDTGAGEARFRALVARDVKPEVVTGLSWVSTLDTLTLRVRSQLSLLGPIGTVQMTTDASAYREAWP